MFIKFLCTLELTSYVHSTQELTQHKNYVSADILRTALMCNRRKK